MNYTLTQRDKAIAKTVLARMEQEGKTYFTSDDLRRWLPDPYWRDPAHEIGAWFAKQKYHWHLKRVGEEVSQITSNNRRRIDLWKPTSTMEGWLASKQIHEYKTEEVTT